VLRNVNWKRGILAAAVAGECASVVTATPNIVPPNNWNGDGGIPSSDQE
jgi:hypothetical protein